MLEGVVYFKNLFFFFFKSGLLLILSTPGRRQKRYYLHDSERPSERLRVTQILSGGVEILSHKVFFVFVNPAFFLLLYLPPWIINTGQDSALQKEERPSFLCGGNSNLHFPDLGDPVLALIFIL